ncbi:MAG TPA: alpha-amylase family glycosyl hydrolase, partial [Acidimicrobiales bacterium]|nr:alpha-amylase family glycosyl hydrolase [Acidimicrobiales bacterium]
MQDVVWWHLYPLGFVGAPQHAEPEVVHRLSRLHPWLDYAVDLGANGLLLGPIFASETHGYDTIDHFRIDPRLGDEDDFAALIDGAHRRGLRVALDGVFNHVGRQFASFQAGQADWFHPDGGDYRTFEGHHQLVTLNHDNPAVVAYITEVMNHWLDRGADGWRLDAAYAVPTRLWARVLPQVRHRHPDAYVFGEVIHGDYARIVAKAGLDAVTQYELWKAIWSSLNEGNFFELAWSLDRHNEFLESFVPVTFVGNHDVTRLASQLADPRHVALAVAILCTIGGTPTIYAGDEQAWVGITEDRPGGDDAIRPAFPVHPAGLGHSGWETFRLHQQLIGLRHRHPWLHRARTRVLHLTNRQLAYETAAGDARLVVALNIDDAPAT